MRIIYMFVPYQQNDSYNSNYGGSQYKNDNCEHKLFSGEQGIFKSY